MIFNGNHDIAYKIQVKKFQLISNERNLISNFLKGHQKFGNKKLVPAVIFKMKYCFLWLSMFDKERVSSDSDC